MTAQNIIAWNCCGARSGEFLREMNELIRAHRPMIIMVMEPKISRAEANVICEKLGRQDGLGRKPRASTGESGCYGMQRRFR